MNPNINPWIFWCGMGAFGAIVVVIWIKLYQKSLTPEGSRKRVAKILERFAKVRKFRVINNLALSDGERTISFDHVLVGYFGILFITTYDKGLIVYGEARSETWRIRHEDESFEVPNPLLTGERDFELVRTLLGRENLYSIPMEPLAVFTAGSAQPELLLSGVKQAVVIADLKKYLESGRFDKDSGLDLEKVVSVLERSNLNKA